MPCQVITAWGNMHDDNLPYSGKREQVTKVLKGKMHLLFPLMSMEYHDVLHNLSLGKMSGKI